MTLSRRDFLKLTGVAAASTVLPTVLPKRAASATDPRVVIVGAGLSGMTSAYEIVRRTGWTVSVYEASDHVGGRTHTHRTLAGGQYAEAGGGGISSNEKQIQNLAKRLGLKLVDTWKHYAGGKETFYVLGQHYTWKQLQPGIKAINNAAYKGWKQIGSRIPTHDDHNAAAVTYDNMSVADFIETYTDYGATTPAGAFAMHDHAIEYGGKADVSSSLELILGQGSFWGQGPYDERLAVDGGNDLLASTMADQLPPGTVTFGHKLTAVTRLIDNTYRVTFDNGGSTVDVIADHLVLAVPATALRSSKVDLSSAGISSLHMTALELMVMGTNAKLSLQFNGKPWETTHWNGDATTDTLIESSWQQSFFSSDPSKSVLVGMNNNDYTGSPAHGVLSGPDLTATLGAVDVLYPGASASFISGQAYLDAWVNDPLIGGSYASTPLGGCTTYGGVEGQREGNIHFAGEHTVRYKRTGTMDGAVESGLRVASEIAT